MRIGLQYPAATVGGDPVAMREFAQAAEELGYAHLTVFEHIVGVRPASGEREHHAEYHELLTMLAFLAGATSTIGLLTAVLVLPLRQAVVVAKQAAEVDVVSGGRLRLGVGVGRTPREYEATGTDYHNRGKRIEEQIALMRKLWAEQWVTFHGEWHEANEIGLTIPPVQRPIPVWMGGGSDRALERIGRMSEGWLSTKLDATAAGVAKIRASAAAAGRDPASVGLEGRLEIQNTTPDEWAAGVEAWAELGATHLTIRGDGTPAEQIELARRFHDEVGLG